jgi:hypothetical protein
VAWQISKKLLTPEQLKTATDTYNEIFKANNTPEVAEQMKEEWQEFLAADTTTSTTKLNTANYTSANLTASGISLDDFASENGSLNPRKLKSYIEEQAASNNSQGELQANYVNPEQRINCGLFGCQRLRTGTLPMENNVQFGAYYQYPELFGRNDPFRFIGCVDNSPAADVVVRSLGCGPTAFVGMIKWYASKGYRFYSTTDQGNIAYNMTAPIGFRNRPAIADYMGSCWNGGGVMTIGAGFRDGGNSFLRDTGSPLKVVSNISHYAGNTWSAPAKADILIRHIGTNRPVIAEYFTGFTQGHYSPVVDYAVYGDGSTGLNIRTVGDLVGHRTGTPDYTWYSLSGTWGTERGVFALE